MPPVVILIPAAGASSRMGAADKLLERVGGEPLLGRQTRAAVATGMRVIVTLPAEGTPRHAARRAAVQGTGAEIVAIDDASEGMAASLRAGAARVGPGAALMVMLPDMPEIGPPEIAALIVAHARSPGSLLRAATEAGLPGHPVMFPASDVGRFARLTGDQGARALIDGRECRLVRLPGFAAITDLDTPEDWAAWRQHHPD